MSVCLCLCVCRCVCACVRGVSLTHFYSISPGLFPAEKWNYLPVDIIHNGESKRKGVRKGWGSMGKWSGGRREERTSALLLLLLLISADVLRHKGTVQRLSLRNAHVYMCINLKWGTFPHNTRRAYTHTQLNERIIFYEFADFSAYTFSLSAGKLNPTFSAHPLKCRWSPVLLGKAVLLVIFGNYDSKNVSYA